MRRRFRKRKYIGEVPGRLDTSPAAEGTVITRYCYGPERCEVDSPQTMEAALESSCGVTWINIDGIPDKAELELLSVKYGVHPLVLEDIQTPGQRPRLEDYGEYLFIVFTMLSWGETTREIREEQVSLVLLDSCVITVQQRSGDVFEPLRRRITGRGGRIRRMGSDYLAFAILDVVVDNYYPVLERVDEEILRAEDETLNDRIEMERVHGLRRELIGLRRFVWPLRNVLAGLKVADSDLLSDEVRPFLSDLHDNGVGVLETFEMLRDHVGAVVELVASQQANRMNQVMKTLTVIASIFIPLTFIAGIYGMNFAHMPELEWHYGYFAVLAGMLVLAVGMLVAFRRRKWL
ncbi:MAG: magnesium/cobalt transporter CorA [Spirochaetota bacterium]